MATPQTTEPWEMIERWKADHPDLAGGAPAPAAPRPRLVPAAAPAPSPQLARPEPLDMIERWRREHPELTGLAAAPRPQLVATPQRAEVSDRQILDIASTPLTVLSAFIVGCILGGIAMTIITGIAFWGFAGG